MGRVMSRVYLKIDNVNPILITPKKNNTVFSVDSQRDCAVPATQYASTKEANLSISTMVRSLWCFIKKQFLDFLSMLTTYVLRTNFSDVLPPM